MCLMMLEATNIEKKKTHLCSLPVKFYVKYALNAVTIGSQCTDNGNCTPIQHSVCDATNKTCQCSSLLFVPSSNKTLCLDSKYEC